MGGTGIAVMFKTIDSLTSWANDHESAAETLAEALSHGNDCVSLPRCEAERIHVLLQLFAETPPRPGDLDFIADRIRVAMGGAA